MVLYFPVCNSFVMTYLCRQIFDKGVKMLRLLTILMLSLSFVPPPLQAQTVAKIPRVGFLAPQGRSLPLFDAFRQGLVDLGYMDGKNIVIEPRFAEGHYERFPDIFSELASLNIDVLAVTGAVTARAAKKSAIDVLIVFSVVVDPVADNVIPNLKRPAGNFTG